MSDSFATLWTVAHQASLSIGFPRQEYWSGLPFPSPGHLPGPGIEPGSLTLQADSLVSEPPGKPSRHYLQSRACYGHFLKRRSVSSKEMKTSFTSPAEDWKLFLLNYRIAWQLASGHPGISTFVFILKETKIKLSLIVGGWVWVGCSCYAGRNQRLGESEVP